MKRPPSSRSHKLTDPVEGHAPAGLRSRLEAARLDVLSLLRAVDSLLLAQHLPDEIRAVFELDADFAEALCVLDHDARGYDLAKLVRDTNASFDEFPRARQNFLNTLAPADRERLLRRIPVVRATLDPVEAYNDVPSRDPRVR